MWEKLKTGCFLAAFQGQSGGSFQFKKSIFSAGNFNPPPLQPEKRWGFIKVSQGEGERDTCSRQQSVANLMHIQNGNTASWWDFWYFVFIKILISVSLLLLFVFFVCLFEKQTILPAPAALWVWFCFTLIYFAQQFKLLVLDPANILLHVDLRAGKQDVPQAHLQV